MRTTARSCGIAMMLLAAASPVSPRNRPEAKRPPSADAIAEAIGAPIFPRPKQLTVRNGSFAIGQHIGVSLPADDISAQTTLQAVCGLIIRSHAARTCASNPHGPVRMIRQPGFAPEAYRLTIDRGGATIYASDDNGLFYGGVSFWQLLSVGDGKKLPEMTMSDSPALPWRGAMLDSARHFQSPMFVRNFIDWMAAHKLNRLHWHLVDDQGWRIEIRAYPRLTEIGSGRIPATAPGAPALPEHRGYYSQEELRSIVAYAAARGITIVPEIEMPGHALSAIRAYPEWGMGVRVPPGVESQWGVFPWLYNTDETTLSALETIFGEVITIFPGKFVHIGGDEAVKEQWQGSPKVQAQMKALGITSEADMQSWFMRRIENFLEKHGRRAIGWDEILEGNIPKETIVMSWRGATGAISAANAGHDAILSPAPQLYLDHVQGADDHDPPGRGGIVSLTSVMAFNPLPDAIAENQRSRVLGLQGNVWTEHIRTDDRVAFMAFPRLSAIAEIGWTGRPVDDRPTFLARLHRQLDRLRPLGLRASDAAWIPQLGVEPAANGQEVRLTLSNETGTPMAYRINRRPSRAYTQPFNIALPASVTAWPITGHHRPGAIVSRDLTDRTVRDRHSRQLASCKPGVDLVLEDDFPADGSRARFLVNILSPCWTYKNAELGNVTHVALTVGQIPFNFQVGALRDAIKFQPPKVAGGEFEIRMDDCNGPLIATLPLALAAKNAGTTRLIAPLAARAGKHDLCITYTATKVDPLWAIDRISLWSEGRP